MSRHFGTWNALLKFDADSDFLLDGLAHGFRLVSDDTKVSPASCDNYVSALTPAASAFLTGLFTKELSQGTISSQEARPLRLNALGAVPKKDSTDLRPITDCSRPFNNAINDLLRCRVFACRLLMT